MEWAIQEVTSPKRVVMSVVPVEGGALPTVSVKTAEPVPKEKIPELMKFLANLKLKAPVSVGQVVAEWEGIKIVATRGALSPLTQILPQSLLRFLFPLELLCWLACLCLKRPLNRGLSREWLQVLAEIHQGLLLLSPCRSQ